MSHQRRKRLRLSETNSLDFVESLACRALNIVLNHLMIPDLGWSIHSLTKKQNQIATVTVSENVDYDDRHTLAVKTLRNISKSQVKSYLSPRVSIPSSSFLF